MIFKFSKLKCFIFQVWKFWTLITMTIFSKFWKFKKWKMQKFIFQNLKFTWPNLYMDSSISLPYFRTSEFELRYYNFYLDVVSFNWKLTAAQTAIPASMDKTKMITTAGHVLSRDLRIMSVLSKSFAWSLVMNAIPELSNIDTNL